MTRISNFNIRNSDIVCGRGKGFDSYAGNQVFRDVIKEYSAIYIAYGTDRTEKSNLIRKIFEDIGVGKSMRFVTRVKEKGWILLEEREAKLKIGHALRDGEMVRQKQARRRVEAAKRTDKKMMKLAASPAPAENTQVWVPFHAISDENTRSENSVRPGRSSCKEGGCYALACQQQGASSIQGLQKGVEAEKPRRGEWEGSIIYEQSQRKEGNAACNTCSDGLVPPIRRYNTLNVLLEATSAPPTTSCCCVPFVPDIVDPIPDECTSSSTNRSTPPDVEPLPLSCCNCSVVDNKEDLMTALSSFSCSSNMGGGGDAGSIDVTLSAIFLDFMEDKDLGDCVDLTGVQPADWLF